MAEYRKCDGCGRLSPDADGLYIANDWAVINVDSKWRKYNRFADPVRLEFCKVCLPYESDPTPFQLIAILKKFFRLKPTPTKPERK